MDAERLRITRARRSMASGIEDTDRRWRASKRVGDRGNEHRSHALLAESLDFLGEADLVVRARPGVIDLTSVDDRRHRHTVLQTPHSHPFARDCLKRRCISSMRRSKTHSSGGGLWRLSTRSVPSEIQRELGDLDAAAAGISFRRTGAQPGRRSSAGLERRAADCAGGAEAAARRTPPKRFAVLSSVLDAFRAVAQKLVHRARRLAARRAYLTQGRDDLAEADLAAGIDLSSINGPRSPTKRSVARRSSSHGTCTPRMIRLQAEVRHRQDSALAFATRPARTLLEARVGERGALPPIRVPPDPGLLRP